MKHLRIFASMEEFEAAKLSMDTPFVVLEEGTPKVIYSNLVEISEGDISSGEETPGSSYAYVDLGLASGLKWATYNVGATKPCESGLLFQFGRVDGYAYGDTNNQFRTAAQNTADTGNQYIPATTSGKTYNTGDVLDSADDAAHVNMGDDWRMPTAADINELLEGTTSEWCQCTVLGEDHTSHTVYGRLFTSKINDATLFIPAAGSLYSSNTSFRNTGSNGYVWSSSVHIFNVDHGYYLSFNSGNCNRSDVYNRCYGLSVRGVRA